MSYVYHTKFYKIGGHQRFKFPSGSNAGPYVRKDTRHYEKNDGTVVKITDPNTKVLQVV